MEEMGLPRFIVVKSDKNKCLSYIPQDGFLQFNGESVESPHAKMAIELAETSDGNHVHLRCCYSNKYWVKSSTDEGRIVAKAAKPEEDQNKSSSTLFQLFFSEDIPSSVRFLHVQSGQYASSTADGILSVSSESSEQSLFKYVDWDKLVILPKYVAFKGPNGMYLNDNAQHLQFSSLDAKENGVANQIFKHNDGSISIKSISDNKFWGTDFSTGRVLVDKEEAPEEDPLSMFVPIRISKSGIALLNKMKGGFCHAVEDTLGFDLPTITKKAQFEITELVTSREVYDVKFRLEDARIYDKLFNTLETRSISNRDSKQLEAAFQFKYVKKSSKALGNSISYALGVKFALECKFPYVGEKGEEVKISEEAFKGEYEWGQLIKSDKEVTTTYKFSIPPMTRVTVSLVGARASCEVPFTYSQRDVFIGGNDDVEVKNDGIFTGDYFYDFNIFTKNQPIVK